MTTPDTTTTEGKIVVMQAHANGADIEYKSKSGGDWNRATTPTWDWSNAKYRVRPIPREWWINVEPGAMFMRTSEDAAKRNAQPQRIECIHVREVIE